VSVQGEIFEWVQEFDSWKQELFIRAAAAPELAEGDAEEIVAMLLGEQGDGARPREINREDLPEADGADQPMVIEQITGIRNVNAIEDGQTLAFKPGGVNVVWGANGAGKTGYSRVLKKAGRTLYPEEVLTNVYTTDRGRPRATLVVKIGDEEHSEDLDLDADTLPLLARICIADARAGEIYLTKETEVDYVPTTLSSLSRLASGLNAVKAALQQRHDTVEVPQIDLCAFGEGTQAATFLAGLDAGTSEAELRVLAELSEGEKEHLSALRKRMGEIQAMQAPQLRAAAERERAEVTRLRDDLQMLGSFVDAEAIKRAADHEKSLREAREAADLAAKQFEAQPFGEIGSHPWRLLWSAAREYAAHLGQALPPDHDPAHCPLCMQELREDARERLRSFDEFVANDVNARLARLQQENEQAIDQLPAIGVVRDRHHGAIVLLGSDEGGLGMAVAGWLDLAETGFERLRKAEFDDLQPLDAPPDLEPWITGRSEEAKRQAEIESGEENEKARAELADLEGRHVLGERLEEALARIRALKEIDRLDKAISQTGTAGVSRKIGTLSQELIQGGLEEALKRQLEALEFRDIEVVPKTRIVKGQPVAGLAFKTVEGVPLTSVLSHGEQRRLALAMFLAEMKVRSDASPIVLDDPTSSIDQEGRRRIARTLLKLGEERQVIVFTHELSLVLELQRHAIPACEVFAQHVKRLGRTVGHVQPSLPWEGLSPKERLGDLDQKLLKLREEYEKHDEENYAPQAGHFCKLLRAAFERAVEDSVLAGVVTRRSDDVHTKQLRTINWSEEICDLVDHGMSENSPWVHDQPLADGASPPSPDELREGLDVYGELLKMVGAIKKERSVEAEKRKKERVAELKAVQLAHPHEKQEDGEGPELKPVPDPDPEPAVDISAAEDNREPAAGQLEIE
jgi:ABC-type transport system involved in cytochrome c biogenesis ATPase subunit